MKCMQPADGVDRSLIPASCKWEVSSEPCQSVLFTLFGNGA